MKAGDIIKLALAGHSASDIKELGELSKDAPDLIKLAETGKKLPEIKDLMSLADAEPSANSADQEQAQGEPTPDYQKLYEESQAKIEKLTATVEQIQKSNLSRDNSGGIKEKDPMDAILDMIKETT